jgi:hypothetical protein
MMPYSVPIQCGSVVRSIRLNQQHVNWERELYVKKNVEFQQTPLRANKVDRDTARS